MTYFNICITCITGSQHLLGLHHDVCLSFKPLKLYHVTGGAIYITPLPPTPPPPPDTMEKNTYSNFIPNVN